MARVRISHPKGPKQHMLPIKPKLRKPRQKGHSKVFMARIAPILARTKAALAKLHAIADGADMTALADLPVMIAVAQDGRPRRRPSSWRNSVTTDDAATP